jgi:hypothetical protein
MRDRRRLVRELGEDVGLSKLGQIELPLPLEHVPLQATASYV